MGVFQGTDPRPSAPSPGGPGKGEPEELFRNLSFGWHLAGIVVVALLLALRLAGEVFAPGPIQDEEVYVAAFARVAAGDSPYRDLPFYYLPPFAVFGAWLDQQIGPAGSLIFFRATNVLAMAALLWLASLPFSLTFAQRCFWASLFGSLAPAVHLALAWGNLSPLAIAFWLTAFLLWSQRPLLAGASLALALLVKPIAPIAIVLLGLHRPPDAKLARRAFLAAGVAGSLLVAALAFSPFLQEFLALSGGVPAAGRSASLHHLLHCFGINISALHLLLAVLLASVVLLRRQPKGPAELYAFAAVAGLLATPIVWSHTLLLTLPLQTSALALAWERCGSFRRPEMMLGATAVLAIQLSNGLGGIETWPLPIQGLFVALPCFAPLGLLLYLKSRRGPFVS